MSWYRAGTAQVTNGSATVLGTGTQWVSKVKIGEAFFGPDGRLYEISNVSSDTSMTLAKPYAGTTDPAAIYDIVPTQSFMRTLATQVADLIALYQQVPDAADAAEASAANALASANTATAQANAATTAKGFAEFARDEAQAAQAAAETAEAAAGSSAATASTKATEAAASASDALASKNTAATSATNAASSASAAADSAADAAASAASIADGPVYSFNSRTGAVTLTKADVTGTGLAKADIGLGNVTNESKATMFTDPTFTGTVSGVTKTHVGLGNVDNTSDANKPISTATQTALDGKEPTIAAGTTAKYWRGDKSWQTLDKNAVGLANVDNTSDANKPISTAVSNALAKVVMKVIRTTNQNIADTTSTAVLYDGIITNVNSQYNPASGRFTPTKAGWYLVSVSHLVNTALSMTHATGTIFQNGTDACRYAMLYGQGSGQGWWGAAGCVPLYFNGTTDYADVRLYQVSASNGIIYGGGSYNIFSATFISP